MPLSMDQLVACGVLTEIEIVGGRSGMGKAVKTVRVCSSLSSLSEFTSGSVAVFEPGKVNIEQLDAESAIRIAAGRGLAGLIFANDRPRQALVTTRLAANRLNIPVIVAGSSLSIRETVEKLDYTAKFPELGVAQSIQDFIRQLPRSGRSPDRLIELISAQLASPVSVVDTSGRCVRGATHDDIQSANLLAHFRSANPSGRTLEVTANGTILVTEPVIPVGAGPANFWLIAVLSQSTDERLNLARNLLSVAVWPLATELLNRSLNEERRGRQRALLLTEIVEHAEGLPRPTVERATALGWQLLGWHMAVAISSREDTGAHARGGMAARVIEDGLKLHGLNVDLVERPEGWVFWTTSDTEPGASDGEGLVSAVRTALEWVVSEVPSASLAAGVGLPFVGTDGIRASIQEAEHACLLARTRTSEVAVEHSDATSVRRLLIGYYSNKQLRDVATHLMSPLRTADRNGELVRTLTAFLDNKSSTTAAAKILGVHRNTVQYRLERITALLKLDFADPEDRLAVHLAIHLAELEPPLVGEELA
jgi:purine catabolism regulator